MLKFLLFEFIISVLIRGSYVELLRTVGSRSFNGSRAVSLVVTRLGRLTPYEFVWWQTNNPGRRLLAPKLLLLALNLFLLGLTLTAEFGSGSVEGSKIEQSYCYGRRSEILTREPIVSLERYLSVKSVLPPGDCVHTNKSGIFLMPLESTQHSLNSNQPNFHCTTGFRDEQPEAIEVRGCSTQPGKILTKLCTEEDVHQLFGTKAVGNAGWERVFPRLNISTIEVLDPKTVLPIFSKTFHRVLVRGVVRDAVILNGNDRKVVNTQPREMHCYMKHYEVESLSAKFWTPRSCYFVHDGIEVLYGVNHRFRGGIRRAQIAFTTAKKIRMNRGEIALVSPLTEQIIARPMANENLVVHRGLLLFVAELLGVRREVSTISSNVRLTVEKDIVDDVVVRLFGFMDGLGRYSYKHRTETGDQVATVDLLFVVPICLLLFLSMVQQIWCMQKRPSETLPCSIEEAVDPESVLRFSSGSRCIDRTGKTLTFQRLMHWKLNPRKSTEEFVAREFQQYHDNQLPDSP